MLFCEKMDDHVTGQAVFDKINNFLKKYDIPWLNCVSICTDGCPSMIGKNEGLKSKVLKVAPHASHIHCMLHRQALAAKTMPFGLKGVMDDAIKVINFIKSRALETRLFENLCEEMGSLHTNLLLHTAVRWLSRGKCLTFFDFMTFFDAT